MDSRPLCRNAGDLCQLSEEIEQLRQAVSMLSGMVITDELTGLYNYRHFRQALDVEIERARRSGAPVALVMLDLDDFKYCNDEYGHETGNRILSAVASILKSTLRKLDLPCRYGGEEFALILPDTRLGDALALAERLREAIAELAIDRGDGGKLSVTASFGVHLSNGIDTLDAGDLVTLADRQLYRAKQQGKNRVSYDELQWAENGLNDDERDALRNMFR